MVTKMTLRFILLFGALLFSFNASSQTVTYQLAANGSVVESVGQVRFYQNGDGLGYGLWGLDGLNNSIYNQNTGWSALNSGGLFTVNDIQDITYAAQSFAYVTVKTYETPSAVPLPAAMPLMASGLGLLGFAGFGRRKEAV
jgi:hypothetical protein